VDQIAAGEVVERPASVVKELVENSLDASARRVRIEVRGGGADLIAVTDDGSGMSASDARLALERHATSKLRHSEDLSRIATFGFRGGALPAIASVSRLRLRTRTRGASEGFEIRMERGRLLEARAAGGPEGTRVEVAQLFAGVPARRKFLKRPPTEWGHVSDWLERVALVLPEVHFEIQRDDRTAAAWPATRDPLDRIAAVLSERDAGSLVAIEREAGRAAVRAFLSRPEAHRPSAAGLYLFVNGRPVRDRLLRHAVLDAYRDVLPRGRFPTALIFLSVPPDSVDVNVHPAKWEVRFADPQGVHRLVAEAARGALGSRAWLGGAQGTAPGRRQVPASPATGPVGSGDWVFARPATLPHLDPEDAARGPGAQSVPGAEGVGDALRFADRRLLGQLLGTYLVLEGKDGLLLVDQHAAHERVLYEHLRASWLGEGVERQALLAPSVVELSARARAACDAEPELVRKLGFDLDGFDERSVAVRAIPALLAGRDPAALVRGLADELSEARTLDVQARADSRTLDAADRLFASLACHSARTAGEVLDPAEQGALLRALDTIPAAPCCPHGRPVAISLTLAEIERRFGRR
jgi:DNA mismatch repair protein MutL